MDASAFNTPKPSVISDDLRRYMEGLFGKPRSTLKFDQGVEESGEAGDCEPSESYLRRWERTI